LHAVSGTASRGRRRLVLEMPDHEDQQQRDAGGNEQCNPVAADE
jgi:hypothetical protein